MVTIDLFISIRMMRNVSQIYLVLTASSLSPILMLLDSACKKLFTFGSKNGSVFGWLVFRVCGFRDFSAQFST